MNTLEIWIQNLIEKPIKFKGVSDVEEHLRKELETSLPRINGSSVGANAVYSEILLQLHLKIRGHKHEDAIWSNVLWYLSHPLPATMAHDLIDRGVATVMMSHTRQEDEVQWRLATMHEDALFQLVRERYTEPQFSVEQFATMLEIYNYRGDSLLTMLFSFWTKSAEKEAVFIRAVERELERISEQKKQRHKREAAYFKQMLATREDIIQQLGKKYRRII